jgi:hypothetical protein
VKAIFALILIVTLTPFAASAADTNSSHRGQVMPLISMEEVPLCDGVRELARQDGINYIFDPVVLASFVDSGGRFIHEPIINGRWTNVTARQVLGELINAYNLTMVTNPATTVARIAFATQAAKPVPASQLGEDTNKAIPLIIIEEVPLKDAIKNLANAANLTFILDPTLLPAKGARGENFLSSLVNLRWLNLTAKQALVALLDNYGLMMVQHPGNFTIQIIAKTPPGPFRPHENQGTIKSAIRT